MKFNPRMLIGARTSDYTKVLHSLPLKKKLPEVELPSVITKTEVQAEKERVRKIKAALKKLKKEAYFLEDEIEYKASKDIAKLVQLQRIKTEEASLKRQLYESRISYLLNQQLYIVNKIEKELEKVGEERERRGPI